MPTEPVDCPDCDGEGMVEMCVDLYGGAFDFVACLRCEGSGWVTAASRVPAEQDE